MAELSVRVEGSRNGAETTYHYEFRSLSADGTGPLEQEHTVTPAPDLVRALCERIDSIVVGSLGGAPGEEAERELAQRGHTLYRTLFPNSDGGVPELVQRMRDSEEPLLIRSNESVIPWELLHDGTDFLGLSHELARRTFVKRRVAVGRTIDRVRRTLVVGDPRGDLPEARAEAEQLAAWLGERGVERTVLLGAEATLLRIITELTPGDYDLLHYCGHVAAPFGTTHVGLLLHDNQLLDARALEPLARSGVPPTVFVNGCASADRLGNLCVSFMEAGAKVVVGTRYPVGEEPARRFAERFYADIIAGATAGAAIHSARRAVRRGPALDWSAFVLYGDPLTRVGVGEIRQAPAAEEEVASPSLDAYRFDGSAGAAMRRMARRAAPLGGATSMDLLTELLATDEMRARAASSFGVERLALVEDLLHTVREQMPVVPAEPDARVELSGTVSHVLARAERGAQEAGRDMIGTADLVTAFLDVGGGSSGQILEAFGLSLNDLAGSPRPVTDTGRRPGDDMLFDEAGRLRDELLTPGVAGALRVAAMLATANGTTISSGMVLYGLAIAGGGVFRERLRAQGEAGRAALDQLSATSGTRRSRFSSRTRRALRRLVTDPSQPLDEADLLAELLSDPESSAGRMLAKLGVDATAVRSPRQEPDPENKNT